MKNIEEVDRLVRDALDKWTVTPPAHIAENIGRQMAWYNFWHFRIVASLKHFVPSMTVTIVGIITVFFILPGSEQINKSFIPSVAGEEIITSTIKDADNHTENYNENLNSSNGQERHNTSQTPGNFSGTPNYTRQEGSYSSAIHANIGQADKVNDAEKTATAQSGTDAEKMDYSDNSAISGYTAMVKTDDNPGQMLLSVKNEDMFTDRIPGLKVHSFIPLNDSRYFPAIGLKQRQSINMTPDPVFSAYFSISQAFVNFSDEPELLTSKYCFPSGSATAGIDYHIGRFFLETGLQYSYFQRNENGNSLLYNPQIIITQTFAGQQQVIESHNDWHYTFIADSAIHRIDSMLVTHYDTSLVDIYVPVASTEYDTIISRSWKSKISILEIPLAAGYTYFTRNTEFSIKGGVLLGIISRSEGYTYNKMSTTGLEQIQDLYSTKEIQYSYFFTASINRNLTENWSVELAPFWRSSINGLKSNDGLSSRKYNAWGIGLGIKYRFYFVPGQPNKN